MKEEDVIKLFKEKNTVKGISKQFNIRVSKVYYILNRRSIPVINRDEIEDVLIEQLNKESKKGKSLQQLSKEYNIEKTKLCKILNSYKISSTKKQTIITLRQAGYRHSIIAQRLSITTESVKEVLRAFNIKTKLKVGLTKEEILNIRTKLERG